MKVIITEMIHENGIELLKNHMEVDCKFSITKEELTSTLADYDAMIVRADTLVDKEVIDSGKNLKAIGMAGIGLNHIDFEYAKKNNVAILNVPDGSNNAVAELTMALILNLVRKINAAIFSVKYKKEWEKHEFMGEQLENKVVGIIALGKIGRKVAKYCQAFGMKVIANDPFISKEIASELNVEIVQLNELLVRSDIISIHAPLTKRTHHLIGSKEIGKMKEGAYILNLGRGGIIDEDSLYNALLKGHLAGAAVDVMEKEPPGDSMLFGLDNFIITPHIGACTIEAQRYISEMIAEQILNHLGLFS